MMNDRETISRQIASAIGPWILVYDWRDAWELRGCACDAAVQLDCMRLGRGRTMDPIRRTVDHLREHRHNFKVAEWVWKTTRGDEPLPQKILGLEGVVDALADRLDNLLFVAAMKIDEVVALRDICLELSRLASTVYRPRRRCW